jgi:hypothetical protein
MGAKNIEFYLDEMEYFTQQWRSFSLRRLHRIQTRVLNPMLRQTQKIQRGILMMTTREKLNLAALALGVTATFAWISLLGVALSRAIAWLL